MSIEKMRSEFEAAFMRELEVDLSGNRHTDDEGIECYQFDGDYSDERSKLASIAFMFWQQSRASLVIELPTCEYANAVSEYSKGHRQGIRACREAIQSTGVKVK